MDEVGDFLPEEMSGEGCVYTQMHELQLAVVSLFHEVLTEQVDPTRRG
jgi:hypothetical protein